MRNSEIYAITCYAEVKVFYYSIFWRHTYFDFFDPTLPHWLRIFSTGVLGYSKGYVPVKYRPADTKSII